MRKQPGSLTKTPRSLPSPEAEMVGVLVTLAPQAPPPFRAEAMVRLFSAARQLAAQSPCQAQPLAETGVREATVVAARLLL